MTLNLHKPWSEHDQKAVNGKLAYGIDEAVAACGLGRSTIFLEIKSGRLRAVKVAGRRLIMRDDLEAFLKQGKCSV
jgi:excisionase family DNA binding protein